MKPDSLCVKTKAGKRLPFGGKYADAVFSENEDIYVLFEVPIRISWLMKPPVTYEMIVSCTKQYFGLNLQLMINKGFAYDPHPEGKMINVYHSHSLRLCAH